MIESPINITVAATTETYPLPPRTVALLLRAATGNAGTTYLGFNKPNATTTQFQLRPSETVTLDLSEALNLKISLGEELSENDFFRYVSVIGTAADTITIEPVTL